MEIQWPLVLFSLLAGTGASALAIAGLSEIKNSSKDLRFLVAIISLVAMVLGGILAVFHLGNPGNVMTAASAVFAGRLSGIAVELILLGLAIVANIIYIFVIRAESSASKALGIISLILGVVAGIALGLSYLEVAAKAAWSNPTFLFAFFFTALAAGAVLVSFLAGKKGESKEVAEYLGKLALIFAGLACLFVLVYVIFLGIAGELASSAIWAVLTIVLAAIGTFGAFKVSKDTSNQNFALIALAGVILAALFMRILMWTAATAQIPSFDVAANLRGLFPL